MRIQTAHPRKIPSLASFAPTAKISHARPLHNALSRINHNNRSHRHLSFLPNPCIHYHPHARCMHDASTPPSQNPPLPTASLHLAITNDHDAPLRVRLLPGSPLHRFTSRVEYNPTRMKILHIITRLIVGGAQENTLLTCEGLRARGHDVTLLTGPSPGPEGSLMDRANGIGGGGGYKVIVTPHLVRSPHPWHDALAYREILRLCRSEKYDVVHTHSSKAGILGRAAAWKADVPLVVHTIHGLPFHPYQSAIARKAWITLERYAARRCHAILCVADAMTRQALAAGIGSSDQFTTVYSGMEVAPFLHPPADRAAVRATLQIPADRLVFGTIARLQPLKGHDDLLAAAADVFAKIPTAHFLWIGDGIFRPRFQAAIAQRGWQDRFTLTGLVPPARVAELLPAMDILVHPSYREGLARALPQALLAGVPVISYDCDGAAEVCLTNQTGILVKTGNIPDLTSAMITLAQNPNRATLGQAGRAFCLARFPADVMVAQIEKLYRQYSLPIMVTEAAP